MASDAAAQDPVGPPDPEQEISPEDRASLSVFEIGVLILALVSPFLTPQLYDLAPAVSYLVVVADWTVSGIFLFKFFVDLVQAESRLAFLKWGWIDLVAAMPAFPLIHSLRLLRLLRLLRAIRIIAKRRALLANLLRQRAQSAFAMVLLLTIVSLFGSAIVILHFEAGEGNITTAEDALWWAFVTITTVGYGDYYPVTLQGRIVASLLAVVGIGLFGVFTGWLASWLMKPFAT